MPNDPAPSTIYKLATADQWAQARRDGRFPPSPDDARDGFIHLSAQHQLEGTARKYFSRIDGLQLLAVAMASLGDGLRWETSRGGDAFPHLYADLPLSAILWVAPVALDPHGMPMIEAALSSAVDNHPAI